MASATPATLERLRDRELIWKLTDLETKVIQDLETAQARLMELSAATSTVCDRLDHDALDDYLERRTEEARAWRKDRIDA